jgi:mono/diheme cytochrome c family protein
MSRRAKIAAAASVVGLATVGLSACGSAGIKLAQTDPNYNGAVLFLDHCSGCHTLDEVGAEGSAEKINDRQKINGPNFNVRPETMSQVLYAIRNGGFSGAIMPENIVVGSDAMAVARFLSKYAGAEAPKTLTASG